MKTTALVDQFHSWLLGTYNDPEFAGKAHCFTVRRNFPFVHGELLDFVSVRHESPAPSRDCGLFSIGLWKFTPDEIGIDAIDEMCRHVQAFRSACAEMVNQLQVKGESGPISIALHGNLVGASVAESPIASLLANGLGDLFFWTYRRGINRVEIEPHFDDGVSAQASAQLLQSLLDHASTSQRRRKIRRTSTPVA